MDLQLAGRTALVTGASKGIGRATAAQLVGEGCHVIMVARGETELREAADAIARDGPGTTSVLPADLADEDARQRVIEAAGSFDILVNNAGGIPGGALTEFDDAAWQVAWQLKVFGCISMCRHSYAMMKKRGDAVIINVIGNAADALDFDYICGSTANAALVAFTRTLGGGSHRDNVRVVGINPGPVATDRLETLMRKKAQMRMGSAENWEALKEPLPFSRPAAPQEIAAMVAFLASDLSAYTSGTVVTIDGGIASQGRTF